MTTVEEAFRQAVKLFRAGALQQADVLVQAINQVAPRHSDAWDLRGMIAFYGGQSETAIDFIRRAIELKPSDAEYRNGLGIVLSKRAQYDEAAACFRRAIELQPQLATAHNNLGECLRMQGWLDEAVSSFRQALALQPDYAIAHSNLLYALMFHPGYDERARWQEHRRWDEAHARPLAASIQPHQNDRSAERRLRIGYVSPDFRRHPIGRFLVPALESHDHERFEIFCYSSGRRSDEFTQRCRQHADVWRPVLTRSDAELADDIRRDQIDILVDLTMHMDQNRLGVFARKPAPVQVTYLAYCGTTGLSAIDYRLTDPYLDPPDFTRYYAERSVWLPQSYWCYQPVESAPVSGIPPSARDGRFTFG